MWHLYRLFDRNFSAKTLKNKTSIVDSKGLTMTTTLDRLEGLSKSVAIKTILAGTIIATEDIGVQAVEYVDIFAIGLSQGGTPVREPINAISPTNPAAAAWKKPREQAILAVTPAAMSLAARDAEAERAHHAIYQAQTHRRRR